MNPILIVSTNMTKKEMESAAWLSILSVLFSCSSSRSSSSLASPSSAVLRPILSGPMKRRTTPFSACDEISTLVSGWTDVFALLFQSSYHIS